MLGFESGKSQFKKKYDSLETTKPNEFWCADVTVFQTLDGYKHYIHILLDHFSKKVLEYQVMDSPSGITIKNLLQTAYNNISQKEQINFLTDGGSENVNHTVQGGAISKRRGDIIVPFMFKSKGIIILFFYNL